MVEWIDILVKTILGKCQLSILEANFYSRVDSFQFDSGPEHSRVYYGLSSDYGGDSETSSGSALWVSGTPINVSECLILGLTLTMCPRHPEVVV